MNAATPRLSVVVCSYNRAEKLPACLDALELQSQRHQIEVIVVDDGSAHPVGQVATVRGARLMTHERNLGLAAARNTGVTAARAPIVAFTDDDCIPTKDWSERLLAAYDDPAVLGVGGAVVAVRADRYLQRYYDQNPPLRPLEAALGRSRSVLYRLWRYLVANVRPEGQAGPRPVYSLVGANFSFRRSALEAVGGFDAGIRFGGEDEDVAHRLRATIPEGVLWFEPEAIVEHDFDPSFADALRRARAYGRGNARNYRKHQDWGATVFPGPPLVAFLIVAGVRAPRRLAVGVAVPLLLAPRWLLHALQHRSPSSLGFAYLQLLQEAANDLGFFAGWIRHRGIATADDRR